MKKILMILNYYYPYISGVSEYARVLAEEWVKSGNEVTVLASNHECLPREENIHGVRVIRAPIICKISKGTISPAFVLKAIRLAKKADIVNMHLPMLESGFISQMIPSNKLITTYHCDIQLPPAVFNRFIIKCMDFSNNLCLKKSRYIAVQTIDYAKHSRVAGKYPEKYIEATTPIKDYSRSDNVTKDKNEKLIGFCGRLVEEKGLDILLRAYEILSQKQQLKLLIGGDYEKVAGGSIYPKLKQYIEEHHLQNVIFLGRMEEGKMEEFYSSLDVFVLPSRNSLEAFGMVQVEAMFCGTPVVATDLYGVRTIVERTGMGEIVKRNDPVSLAQGIQKVLQQPQKYIKSKEEIQKYYGTQKCVSVYEEVINNY